MPKNGVWGLGWRPKHPYLCTLEASKGVFEYLGWGCLKRTMPKNGVWGLGPRPKHPYLCTLQTSKGVFEYLGWGCLKRTMPYNGVWGLGWRPSTHTSVPYRPVKVFLGT